LILRTFVPFSTTSSRVPVLIFKHQACIKSLNYAKTINFLWIKVYAMFLSYDFLAYFLEVFCPFGDSFLSYVKSFSLGFGFLWTKSHFRSDISGSVKGKVVWIFRLKRLLWRNIIYIVGSLSDISDTLIVFIIIGGWIWWIICDWITLTLRRFLPFLYPLCFFVRNNVLQFLITLHNDLLNRFILELILFLPIFFLMFIIWATVVFEIFLTYS